MGMLIGVVCEVVSVIAQLQKEEARVRFVKNKIRQILFALDADDNESISKHEFQAVLLSPEAMVALHDVDVDVVALVDLKDMIFRDREELSFGDFMEILLQFCGTK